MRHAKARTLARRAAILLLIALMLGALIAPALFTTMPGTSHLGALPPLSPQEVALERALRDHVTKLAAPPMAPRSARNPAGYRQAAAWLEAELLAMGYTVTRRPVTARGATHDNLIAAHLGTTHPSQIIVIGAHYDAHDDTPGADDNASGTAALLEIARALKPAKLARTVRFELYANEEPPYFQYPDQMGSRVLASDARARGDDIALMVSLEMLGYYATAPNTQHYPSALRFFYPDRGDFIALVSRWQDRALVRDAVGWWRDAHPFPVEGFAGPRATPGIDYSDHWSYWEEGYPALMVTDTSFFRNAHYHKLTDTPDTLDYPRFARVTSGLIALTTRWANAPERP